MVTVKSYFRKSYNRYSHACQFGCRVRDERYSEDGMQELPFALLMVYILSSFVLCPVTTLTTMRKEMRKR